MRAQDSSDGMPYLSLESYCESDNLRGSGNLRVCYDGAPWEKSNAAPVGREFVRVSAKGVQKSNHQTTRAVRIPRLGTYRQLGCIRSGFGASHWPDGRHVDAWWVCFDCREPSYHLAGATGAAILH